MQDDINAVDLAFIVDTTGSMGGLIAAAQNQMIALLEELTQAAQIDLRLGIVEYRDHPPQDKMVYRTHAFTSQLQQAQQTIRELTAQGGGDAPEAVLDGVVAACRELRWRKHARRLAVLVGDAPPHGVGAGGDSFANGCPCGETIESITCLAENTQVTIHALGLTAAATTSFTAISSLTGGKFFAATQANEAIQHLSTLLRSEFGHLELDRRVLAAWRENPDISIDELAEQLASSRHEVSTSLVRLFSRDLITAPVTSLSE